MWKTYTLTLTRKWCSQCTSNVLRCRIFKACNILHQCLDISPGFLYICSFMLLLLPLPSDAAHEPPDTELMASTYLAKRRKETGAQHFWYRWNLGNIMIYIHAPMMHCKMYVSFLMLTSSTAQGGGGSFKNRKPIGDVGCCESGMAERCHWLTERWLELCLLEWLQWLQWSPLPHLLDVVRCTATVVVVVA